MLIYIIMLIYGTMVMRGVMEEKISRIAEVMVSSVRPFQLMMGKIIGIGAVGLTQFAIWIALIGGILFLLPAFGSDFDLTSMPQGPGAMADTSNFKTALQVGIGAIPIGMITFCFIFYFLGGYL
jgi:ABC-2 type transport system permease protein